nr:unnamed protein product [Callosobruchus chinensis]
MVNFNIYMSNSVNIQKSFIHIYYSRRNLDFNKEYFNMRLSRGRRFVECAFGIINAKFQIFWKPIETSPHLADKIIKCICILHNTIIDSEGIDIQNEDVLPVNFATETANIVREAYKIHICQHRGHLPNHERGGGRPANPEEDEVLEAVEEDPSTSLRAIEITTGVPKGTAHRILKRHELHPYHVQRVQTLLPADYQRRVNFSRTILERYRDDPFF